MLLVAEGGKAQRALVSNVEQIKQRWRHQLEDGKRKRSSDAAVTSALELLPRHLVLTSQKLVDELGITRKASLATLHRLARARILTEYGTLPRQTAGQPATLYVSRDLLGLAGSNRLR
jgi:hypothetical protein